MIARILAPLALIVALCVACYFDGKKAGLRVLEAQLSEISAEHSKQLAAMEAIARGKEQALVQQVAAIAYQHEEQLKDEQDKSNAVKAGLRAGAVQLRKRFACDASTSGVVPSAAPSTTSSDEATGLGLQGADAEFLIREATAADEVVLQLQACQGVVHADRDTLPP